MGPCTWTRSGRCSEFRSSKAMICSVEMLREDAEALKQDTEPLDRVLGAARHLLALINDILDLSKIEAGRMELQLEDFALAPLIDSVVKTVEPLAVKNANQVAVHCDAAIGTLHADEMRLRQALLNLMSNANKFTDHGQHGREQRNKAHRACTLRQTCNPARELGSGPRAQINVAER